MKKIFTLILMLVVIATSGCNRQQLDETPVPEVVTATEEGLEIVNDTPMPEIVKTDSPNKREEPTKSPSPEIEVTSAATERSMGEADAAMECTISVRCDEILKNKDEIAPEKLSIVPDDGIILAERNVSFQEGESVFDVLLRELKKNKIHMEFENSAIFNSVYIEGINNLYEGDCGDMSGWIYYVNGKTPKVGCSSYKLSPGDRVEWVYNCGR